MNGILKSPEGKSVIQAVQTKMRRNTASQKVPGEMESLQQQQSVFVDYYESGNEANGEKNLNCYLTSNINTSQLADLLRIIIKN